MTRRAPQRSTSQPIAGQDSAARAACIVRAEENIARPTPSSAVIGFRKTPKAKTLIAPPPTIKPQTVANTIHQRFAKMPRIDRPSLYSAALAPRRWPVRREPKGECAGLVPKWPALLRHSLFAPGGGEGRLRVLMARQRGDDRG